MKQKIEPLAAAVLAAFDVTEHERNMPNDAYVRSVTAGALNSVVWA